MNIRLSQKAYRGKYIFSIDVDGLEAFNTINKLPREYKNVKVLLEERGAKMPHQLLLRNFKVYIPTKY